jgi:hypothetical protein
MFICFSTFNDKTIYLHLQHLYVLDEPGSSVSIVSGYEQDDLSIEVRSLADERILPLASVSRPALGPTQSPA